MFAFVNWKYPKNLYSIPHTQYWRLHIECIHPSISKIYYPIFNSLRDTSHKQQSALALDSPTVQYLIILKYTTGVVDNSYRIDDQFKFYRTNVFEPNKAGSWCHIIGSKSEDHRAWERATNIMMFAEAGEEVVRIGCGCEGCFRGRVWKLCLENVLGTLTRTYLPPVQSSQAMAPWVVLSEKRFAKFSRKAIVGNQICANKHLGNIPIRRLSWNRFEHSLRTSLGIVSSWGRFRGALPCIHMGRPMGSLWKILRSAIF